jgi:YaiO family outer membrane protein
MRRRLGRLIALAAAAGLALAAAPAARAQSRDDVRQAVYAGSFDRAIALALEALEADPGNAEIEFLLARAYAYSGRFDEAEARLDGLLARYPADADLVVFKARMMSWRGDTAGAERTFLRALELQPRSADALTGLADLAARRGEGDAALGYARRALEIDADHAGALFRTGSVLVGRGDYGRGRGYLARAAGLEPLNKDFARALAAAVPVYARRAEIWLGGRNESWNDGRPDSRDVGVSALFSVLGDRARLVVGVERLWRAGTHDDRLSLQAYPQLWRGAYASLDLAAAPGADAVPSSSARLEVYQSFLGTCEASLGGGWVKAAGLEGAKVLSASAAAFLGPWYPSLRVQWSDAGAAGTELTWAAGLRRFLAEASYLWISVGRGTRTFEAGSTGEVLARPAWFVEAGADIYVFKDVKLRASVARRAESAGPSSTTLALVTGYRF